MVDVVYVDEKCICEKLNKEGQKYSVGRIIHPPPATGSSGPPLLDDEVAESRKGGGRKFHLAPNVIFIRPLVRRCGALTGRGKGIFICPPPPEDVLAG
jgi:hypothetical protein